MGEGLEALGEEFVEAEEFDFFRAFATSGYLTEIVHLALGWSLAEVFRVAEEGVVRLSDEGWEDAEGEKEDEPWGCPCEGYGEDQGGDDLLEEAAHLLDHGEAVGGLNAGSLEAIVEEGIFVGGEVEAGSLLHDADADVLGIAVSEERVGVVDGTGDDAEQDVEGDFGGDEGPEVSGQGLAAEDAGDVADDPGGYFGDAEGEDGDDDAEDQPPGDDGGAGLPEDMEYGWDVLKRAQPLAPWTFGFHLGFHLVCGSLLTLRWQSVAGMQGEFLC